MQYRKPVYVCLFSLAVLVLGSSALSAQQYSKLWGKNGELWNPEETEGGLRDFTNVGYMAGDEPIPFWPVGVDVTDFGAVPDDLEDDTQAFRDAIAACPDKHAVFVPKGRYMLFEQLRVEDQDYFVLRGEDMFETVLFFPHYLVETDSQPSYKRTVTEGMVAYFGGTHRSIENLTLQHREQMKGGHWEFRGADGFTFNRVKNSWMRHVRIINADHSILLDRAEYISILNVILDNSIVRPDITGSSGITRWTGHVGIGMGGSSHNLIHNLDMRGKYFHPFDIINVPGHNVLSNVRGNGGLLNNHGQGARYNLYTNLDFGPGGSFTIAPEDKGRQQNETHWGIDADTPIERIPTTTNNGHIFVGINADMETTIRDGFHYEAIDPDVLEPRNLYLAQMEYKGKPLPQGSLQEPPPQDSSRILLLNPTADIGAGRDNGSWLPVGGYLKFDLREQDLETIERARLRLFTSSGLRSAPLTLGVTAVEDDSWTEEGLTKQNKPADGAVLTTKKIENDLNNVWLDFDITEYVRDQAAGDGIVSLRIPVVEGGGGFVGGFNSREHGNAPILVIEKVPASDPGPPSAPQGMRTEGGPGYISLDWEDNPESDVVTYNVYRRDEPAEFGSWGFPIATGLVTSEYRDVSLKANRSNNDLPAGRTFYYVITAVDTQGYESPLSEPFSGEAAEKGT